MNTIPIVGSWNLVSFRLQRHNGEVLHPFGENAKGLLVYTDDGWFSVQLMQAGRAPSASSDPAQCTLGEMERYFKGCISYFGTYQLYSQPGLIIHHVAGALHPNWEGRSFKRYCTFADGLLQLKTPYLVWNREDRAVATVTWRALAAGAAAPPAP